MKHAFIALLIMTFPCCFASCSKEEESEFIYSPAGNTYENTGLSLYFESKDSVSFHCLPPWDENIKGKAAYKLNGALLCIESPFGYGVRPDPEDLTIPYFYKFWCIVKSDRLDNVSFYFLSPNEQIHYMDYDGTFYLTKDK